MGLQRKPNLWVTTTYTAQTGSLQPWIFITVINFAQIFWHVDPGLIPKATQTRRGKRLIRGGPLIKLEALQSLLKSGDFDSERLWLATVKCEKDLRKESWSISDVLHLLMTLDGAQDYYKSEWCEVLGGRWVPCDVYRTPYDAQRRRRHPKGRQVYIKFSIEWEGTLAITLVSCHAA